MLKNLNVAMLVTEKAIKDHTGGLVLFANKIGILKEYNPIHDETYAKPQHLYLISNEEIPKEGDYHFDKERNQIIQNTYDFNINKYPKVIASTDKSLIIMKDHAHYNNNKIEDYKLSQIPDLFIQAYIKAYNEGKPITEVQVEYEYHENPAFSTDGRDDGYYLKTNPDNTVIIHQNKIYSRDEVINLLEKYGEYLWIENTDTKGWTNKFDNWIKENL